MAVSITEKSNTIQGGTPVALFQTQIASPSTSIYRQQYDVASDGRFLINTTAEDATSSPITLLQNWKPPAK
jgi:hypothetical protein